MASKSGGGAATNSGIDYQQRVAAVFVLSMGLGIDVSDVLQRNKRTEIYKISFETSDAIDDIVITHASAKTYMQVKRKLSFSQNVKSEFYKTIEQFVCQYKKSKNLDDCFAIVTSDETSRKILRELRKLTNSSRLSEVGFEDNPRSKSENDTYNGFLKCVESAANSNGLNAFTVEESNNLLKKIYIISLSVESSGSYENSFLALIAGSFNVTPHLIWNFIISKSLDWSKNRQSVDRSGIKLLLDKFLQTDFVIQNNQQELSPFFKIEFDPENHDFCSGREVVIIDSFLPEFDIALLEMYRFDDEGNFRLKFHDGQLETEDGEKHKLYGRFSTFDGAGIFMLEHSWTKEKRIMIGPINGEHDYDADPISIAYSDKIKTKLSNSDTSVCLHCGYGLFGKALLVEVNEEGLPFDVGLLHRECLRVSDRVLGRANNPGTDEYPELKDFDCKKWFSGFPGSQALWSGTDDITQPIKMVVWNSEAAMKRSGDFCIKVVLMNGSCRYVQERGKVQRYTSEKADHLCQELNKWRNSAKDQDSPLCYSSGGEIFGEYDDIQNNSNKPIDLVECIEFHKTRYTRGISEVHDGVNNFYAPLMLLVQRDDNGHFIVNNSIFLITNPMDLKVYLDNWKNIGFAPSQYRTQIIETDGEFDELMHWANERQVNVLVDPFYDKSNTLIKGAVVQDIDYIRTSQDVSALLFTLGNGDGTFTHLFRDFDKDITLLLDEACSGEGCHCMGCSVYDEVVQLYGTDNLDIRSINKHTTAIDMTDKTSVWDPEIIKNNSVNWEVWQAKVE